MRFRFSKGDIAVGSFFVIVAIWFFWKSWKLPPPINPSDVGAGELPMLISIALLICAIGLIIRGVCNLAGSETINLLRPWAILLAILVLAVYRIIAGELSLYVSSAILIITLMRIAGERNWVVVLMAAGGFNLFAYICFNLLLQVPLY